jgi:streptomycin 3"-adenylyltransferase
MSFILNKIVELFKIEIGSNLTGIYLHGSLAMGGFNTFNSDIDFLVIVKNKLTIEEKKRVIKGLLKIDEQLENAGGIEMSIILENHLTNFVYPTPFELHYSNYHKESYKTNNNYICGDISDPDLAAHITVVYSRGITLWGTPIKDIFKPIDRQYYIQSILSDVKEAPSGILESPVYYALNLCRVMYFLKENIISSKKEAGYWAVNNLPYKYRDIVLQCLNVYSGINKNVTKKDEELVQFAEFILGDINGLLNYI